MGMGTAPTIIVTLKNTIQLARFYSLSNATLYVGVTIGLTVGVWAQDEGAAHSLAAVIAAACGVKPSWFLCGQGLHGGARSGC